jgi:predicted DNA binding protein
MSWVARFVLPAESFVLGDALQLDDIETIEFACNIPTRIGVMPYFWVWGSAFTTFEEVVEAEEAIRNIEEIDRLENSRLYRVEWKATVQGLLDAVRQNEAVLSSAIGEDQWEFEVLFQSQEGLSGFADQCSEIGLDFEMENVQSLSEPVEGDYGLTPAQRETLITAEQGGYFEEPRQMTMDEVADEMGLSPAAVSGRLRRGVSTLIQQTLLSDSS